MIYVCKYSNILQAKGDEQWLALMLKPRKAVITLTRVFSIGTAKVFADDIMQGLGDGCVLVEVL
jgi:hypothetical protein